MSSSEHNPDDLLPEDPHDVRVGELLNEFFDRRQQGENLSKEDFLSLHPDYADDLRGHLDGLALIDRFSSSSMETLPGDGVVASGGSSGETSLNTSVQAMPEIPGYSLLKQIGRGGMGVVYKAKQVSTKRVVALKLLLEGPLATDTARRRFEREIALAAHLRHPNIIPIYDSGNVDGRMYYAMEHIYGLSLSEYTRINPLSIREKLQLFVKICVAVGHAHQRGVIHRDIKPSNVLVDAEGEPHILDFGLAKAGAMADMSTSITAQIVGTPAYMSPEQAAGDPGAIDMRTDVYSLGVVLYEILTGEMPYRTSGAIGKVLDNIAHAEPAPPHKLNSKIDGDLSAIILFALQKNKDERYQTVHALSSDVERYLAGEPISAKPARSLYLLRKIMHKHRYAIGIAALLVISISSVFGMFSVLQMTRKEKQELQAVITEQDEKVRTLEQDAQQLTRERDQAAVAAAKTYDVLRQNVDPEVLKDVEPIIDPIADGMARGQDSLVLIGRLMNDLIGETPPQEETPRDSSKPLAYDPTEMMISPLHGYEETPQEREIPPEVAQAAEVLKTFLRGREEYRPTTQPASSQPASQSPTSAPSQQKDVPPVSKSV